MLTKRHHRSLLAVISNMIVAIGMLLFALPMTGQLASNYRIKTIGKDQGLSNSAVMSLYRDDLGRIWIGTYDGLNLYNGITVKSFMSDGGQKSLLSNNIMLIDRAENNCLWLTTNLGLNRFSMSEQCVVGSYLSQHGGLRVFSYAWGNGRTWAIDDRGVYYYCSRHDHFVRTSLPYKHVDQDLSFVDKNNVLWLVFTNGDILKASAYNFNADDGKTVTSKVRIHALPFLYMTYQEGMILFVDIHGDLYIYSPDTRIKLFVRNISDLIKRNSDIKGLSMANGNIFLCFLKGECYQLRAATHYQVELVYDGVRVFTCLKDPKQDILWIGSDCHGLLLFRPGVESVRQLLFEQVGNRVDRPVRSIFVDAHNNLWLATKGDGVLKLPPQPGANGRYNYQLAQCTIYYPNTRYSLSSYNRSQLEYQVLTLRPDIDGQGFWAGGGLRNMLSHYDPAQDRIVTLANVHGFQFIHDIIERPGHVLWISTEKGLFRLVTDAARTRVIHQQHILFKAFKSIDSSIGTLIMEGDSVLWMTSRGYGLLRYDIRRNRCIAYRYNGQDKVSANDVLCCCRLGNDMWLGTNVGLIRMSFRRGRAPLVSRIGNLYPMLNSYVHGIIADRMGNLWLSTDNGLVKYNPKTGIAHSSGLNVFNKLGEYSDGAVYRRPNSDDLYFGSVNGLLSINSRWAIHSAFNPEIDYYNIDIDGKPYAFDELYNHDKQRLELTFVKGNLRMNVAILDYEHSEDYEIFYRLVGRSDHWHHIDNNLISLSNLRPGDYTLQLRGRLDTRQTSDCVRELNIHVSAPWYLSFYAICFYLIIVALLAVYGVRFWRHSHRQASLLREHLFREQKDSERMLQQRRWRSIMGTASTLVTNGLSLKHESPDEWRDSLIAKVCDDLLSLRPYGEREVTYQTLSDILKLAEEAPAAPYAFKQLADDIVDQLSNSLEEGSVGNIVLELPETLKVSLPCHLLLYTLRYILLQASRSDIPVHVKCSADNDNLHIAVEAPQPILRALALQQNNRQEDHSVDANLYRISLQLLKCTLQSDRDTTTVSIPLPDAAPTQAVPSSAGNETLLLLEDNPPMASYLADVLSADYQVHCTSTIKEAFSFLESEHPTVFLADLQICFREEWLFTEYATTVDRGVMRDVVFVPMFTWQGCLRLGNRLDGLTDGFLIVPTGLVAVRQVIACARSSHGNAPARDDNAEIKESRNLSAEGEHFLSSVHELVLKNLGNEQLTVPYLAEQMNISSRMFYRKFKEVSSLSPTLYIKNIRLERAAALLAETNMSIGEILFETGFQSKAYFYKCFFARYGCTPKSYRAQKRVY